MASKHYHFKFNFDHDREIIDRIESKDNKNDYIRNLILSDMAADILRESIKLEEQDPEYQKYQEDVSNIKEAVADPDFQSYQDYVTNLNKISKTHLNSLYGQMVSNDSNALESELNVDEEDGSDG